MRRGVENTLLALLYVYFVLGHLGQAHQFVVLPMVIQESLLAGMFLTRRASVYTSRHPSDWFVGLVGSFLPLVIRPGNAGWSYGPLISVVGLCISILALLSLGRSIGIVAANRGVKTGGMYRVVRHPMYTGHLVCLVGYLVTYPSVWNLGIVWTTFGAIVYRMEAEERVLRLDPVYRAYARRVPFHLIPGVL